MKAARFENLINLRLPLVSRIVSGMVTALGGLVLLFWALVFLSPLHVPPTLAPMHPLCALNFVLAGLSLWRLLPEPASSPPTGKSGGQEQSIEAPGWIRPSRDRCGVFMAGFVVLIAGFKIADHSLGWHLDFSRLLSNRGISPAGMPPYTNLSFLLCGLGLLLWDIKGPRGFRPAEALILVVGLASLLALIAHAYRVLILNRVVTAAPMSFDTAVGFGLFSLGFLGARPRRGVMTVLTGQTLGGAMARRLLPMAVLIPFVLGALLLLGEEAGWYGGEFALSCFVVGSILIFTTLIWWNARLLHLADLKRAHVEEQLRRSGENLTRSNTDLQQFAYVASHDLFEPLRMITSYLQLLEARHRQQLDPQAREFIGFALDGANRMAALIHDLLAYSRLDVRGRPLQPTDCEQVLQAALSNLKVAIDESGAAIVHEPLPSVLADAIQLTQLFQNLIGNAIKFRGESPPRIEIKAQRQNGDWLFSVRDNGIGIDPKYFDRIFVIFQRLHTRQEYAGTGMGLSICKKIVERHGGRIWVESAPGHGTTFFFTLPYVPQA